MSKNTEEKLFIAREKIEALLEEYEIENYVVILDAGDMTFTIHSVEEDKALGIIGFMELLKYDFIKSLKEQEVEVTDDEMQ